MENGDALNESDDCSINHQRRMSETRHIGGHEHDGKKHVADEIDGDFPTSCLIEADLITTGRPLYDMK